MTIGLLARADQGGLASQTHGYWKHLRPHRTIVLDLGKAGRGPLDISLYHGDPGVRVVDEWKTFHRSGESLFDGIDVLFTAEGWYDPTLPDWCAANGIRTVVHANPELFDPIGSRADQYWVPTSWRHETMPRDTEIVPVPVDLGLHPYRQRTGPAVTFFHPGAPAMGDRNGSQTLWAALSRVKSPIRVVTRSPFHPPTKGIPRHITVDVLGPCTRVEDAIPPETDVMVIPRRYGGLCLSAQEAAARGIPILMTDLAPQRGWLPRPLCIPTLEHRTQEVWMKGGAIPVHEGDAVELATRIDELANDGGLMADCSAAVRAYAESISWDVWDDRYRELLSG